MLKEIDMVKVKCDVCGYEYDSDIGYCLRCDETVPPEGTICEWCENLATSYVQDHPVCDDHYESSYPID